MAAELRGAPVIVLLLDALRADALEFYGGREGLVPNLARVAAEGTVFDQAYAHAAYTLSSVASTLTSRPTWEHGVWRKENKVLDGVGTWPEGFRAAGYRTAAVTHTPNGSSMSGFERGFDTYIENLGSRGRPSFAVQVLDSVDEILAADDGRPLFLWLHLVEPHEPYQPPEPWSERFDPDYEGEVHGVKEFLLGIRGGGIRPTPTELKHLRLEYDANLGYVDEVIGELRTSLEEAGVWDDAIFVLFSDHGEAFMEHRVKGVAHQGHGRSIYEEVMRIPLVVRLPTRQGRAGLRSEGLVNSLDLYPTLAELLGVEWPGAPHSGRSFAEQLVEAGAPGRPSALYHTSSWSRDRFYPGFGMRVGRHKVFLSPGEYFELYDLEADPGELRNLAPEQPVFARALLEHFAAQTGWDAMTGGWTLQQGAQSEISEAQLELLDALGYGGD